MKLIVGLGNAEGKYQHTRHNVGFGFVDFFNAQKDKPVGFVAKKTGIAMNSSGVAVVKLVENCKLKIENLFVVHDDLDIPLGQFKIQFGRGPKDHNGIKSVNEELGSEGYWRIRIGIENRDPANRMPGEQYTLEDFLPEEKEEINKVYERIVTSLRHFN